MKFSSVNKDTNLLSNHSEKLYVTGAFITSTSRLVLPIDEISWSSQIALVPKPISTENNTASLVSSIESTTETKWVPLPPPDQTCYFTDDRSKQFIQRIETLVNQEIAKHSVRILDDMNK